MKGGVGAVGGAARSATNPPAGWVVSTRSKLTAPAAAPAFLVTNTRPIRVAAHSVPWSDGALVVATTYSPARFPNEGEVRSCPIGTQSPHVGRLGLKYTVLQSWDLR